MRKICVIYHKERKMEQKNVKLLLETPLFAGVAEPELTQMLGCLAARRASYARGEAILHAGDRTAELGVLLSGEVHLERTDAHGNRELVGQVHAGGIFAEVFACLRDVPLSVTATAAAPAQVLFLDVERVLHVCPSACAFHSRVVQNLLHLLAGKNYRLTEKLEHISRRTTREKLLSYLAAQSRAAHSTTFFIPFNRQQLADYLAVDRSAMSKELARMRADGLIEYERNRFRLMPGAVCGLNNSEN